MGPTRRSLWLGCAVAVLAGGVGCSRESVSTNPAIDGEGSYRPRAVEDNRRGAADLKPPELFASIPADTPYVFTQFSAFPKEFWQSTLTKVGPGLDRLLGSIEDINDDPMLSAILAEIRPNLNADGPKRIGVGDQPRLAIYGLGLWPVVRMEIEDGKKVRALVDRIATKAGKPLPPTLEHEGIDYWRIDDGEVAGIVAIRERELIGAIVPVPMLAKQLPLILGTARPAKSMKDGAALRKLVSEYGFAPYGLGYVDLGRVAALAIELGGAKVPPGCKAEIDGAAVKVPRFVLGYDEVTENGSSMTMMLELAPEAAKRLLAVRTLVPGLSPRQGKRPMFALGFAADVGGVLAIARDLGGELQRVGSACAAPELAEFGGELASDPGEPVPGFSAKAIRGFSAVVIDAQFGAGGPTAVDGYAVYAGGTPERLLEEAAKLTSSKFDIPADGKFHPVTFALPGLTNLQLSRTKDQLVATFGAEGLKAARRAIDETKGHSPLFLLSYDYGRLMQSIRALTGASLDGATAEIERTLFDTQAQLFGVLSMWAYAADRGLGFRFTSDSSKQ